MICSLFNDALRLYSVEWWDELVKDLKGSGRGLFDVLSRGDWGENLNIYTLATGSVVKQPKNRKFWEELIAYFPWYDSATLKTTRPAILLFLRVYSLPW
jgi:hypothetical protein